ncbi:TetR/AcrR family transcriptional regulator [Conexibacter arvalis]|uniref:AcrR family transcriptional regulator n=1 Tax=Conexibacter arvalis TaxID=912552 RepID=A0A840IH31_9ACTN|nr:TetR/AcrR family transcriptional regulator [Conexibacter arvalis]MBB4663493.1 AcrR family transcriptional regulator [Conexibacter arvalis]
MATVDTTRGGEAQRTLRADARRNRERVLAAASAAFAEEGFDVGVAAIARRAGVGTGTLFRHFPTKLELEVAVVLERAAGMSENLQAALAEPDPWEAFTTLMTRIVEQTSSDRCLGQATKPELLGDPRIQELQDELLRGVEEILRRGRDAGVLRRDVTAEDIPVLASAIGTTMERFRTSQPELWRRYLGVVLDGLRADGAAPLEPGPPGPDLLSGTC